MIKQNQFIKVLIAVIVVSLVIISCEDFADETFELSAIDEAAINSISDTLELSLAMKSANILNANGQLGVTLVGGGVGDTILMSIDTSGLTIDDVYSAMLAAPITPFAESDIAYSTTIRTDSLSYQLFEAGASGTYVIYLTHFAALSFYDANGRVEMTSDDMSPELIAGLYDLPGPVPVIKGRYEYNLDAGTYLFEIARLEATKNDNFRVVIRREQ